ncbi:OmpA family protein [Chitinophaga sp. YR573]|uniref:OmpA family protein n=1 Tax=Chitinophaga sp. YR573 TaxID=1881040 RepID=UPI0008B9B7B0|nr:OmpA family protein [Chitinophaga sp. YR573]SEW14757.1 OmpA family protein [Chitinophaga sp. YR573]
MKKVIFAFILAIVISIPVFAQEDVPGCKDSPMFNRMPNTLIAVCSKNYDEFAIPTAQDKSETKEGTKTFIQYAYNNESGVPAPSFFQIVKNFENAILKTGGKKVYYNKDAGIATFFTKSSGKDVWVVLQDMAGQNLGNFELNILEIEGMQQDINASDLLDAINKNGSIALYINFETGKSDIKPESQKIIGQVAEMLKSDPSMKISVEGHTDNAGTPAANKTLSENRAKSVMNALITEGIDKTRLSSKGWGQTKPLSDNNTEEGKAKNRRVEIVKL